MCCPRHCLCQCLGYPLLRFLGYSDDKDLSDYVRFPLITDLPSHLYITLSDRLELFVRKNALLQYLHSAQLVLVFVLFITHIYTTYGDFELSTHSIRQPEIAVEIVELTTSLLYLLCFIFEYFCDAHELDMLDRTAECSFSLFRFMCRASVLLELLTILPISILYIVDLCTSPDLFSLWSLMVVDRCWFYVFSLMMLFRLGVVVRISVIDTGRMRKVWFEVVLLCTFLVSLFYLFASLLMLIENAFRCDCLEIDWSDYVGGNSSLVQFDNPLVFHDAVYCVFATVTTTGYGDVVPLTIPGKMFIIVCFVTGSYLILRRASRLFHVIRSQSKLLQGLESDEWLVSLAGMGSNHAIVAGNADVTEIVEFIKEFLTESHGKTRAKKIVVVVHSRHTKAQLIEVFRHPFFSERVRVFLGRISHSNVLDQVQAATARGVFLLSDFKDGNPEAQDTEILMDLLAVKNYHVDIPVFVLCMLDSNVFSFYEAGARVVVNADYLKLSLIAQSLFAPGLTTLITNLLLSTSTKEVEKALDWSGSWRSDDPDAQWVRAYAKGAECEIYLVPFSGVFVGLGFREVVEFVFSRFEIVLIGVKQMRARDSDSSEEEEWEMPFLPDSADIILNPDGYTIQNDDEAVLFARSVFHAQVIHLFHGDVLIPVDERRRPFSSPDVVFADDMEFEMPGIAKSRRTRSMMDVRSRVRRSKRPHSSTAAGALSKPLSDRNPALSPLPNLKPDEKLFRRIQKRIKKKNRTLQRRLSGSRDQCEVEASRLRFEDVQITSAHDFVGHVILMGELKNATIIIQKIRTFELRGRQIPVVLLCLEPRETFQQISRKLCFHEEVYFLRGSSTCTGDLRKAGLENCLGAVYLTEGSCLQPPSSLANELDATIMCKNSSRSSTGGEVVDAEAIKTVLICQAVRKDVRLLVELVFRSSIQFLRTIIPRRQIRPGICSRVVCQSVVSRLRDVTGRVFDEDFETFCLTNEQFATGRCFTRSFFVRLVANCFFCEEVVMILESLCGYRTRIRAQHKETAHVRVRQTPVPLVLAGLPYGEVFLRFLHEGVICIGLYKLHESEKKKPLFHYTVTCAPSEMVVGNGDRVFVLCSDECFRNVTEHFQQPVQVE